MIDPALLGSLPLLADGSIGDELRRAHPGSPEPVEALNLRHPERVQAVHEAFAQAGARLHRTNTARANAVSLAAHGLAERAEAINNSGSALVRAAIGARGLMAGTLAPLLLPADAPPRAPEALARAYAEQAIYLSDTGVDFFVLEHFRALEALLELTRTVKRVSDAPVLAQLTLDARGRTREGVACDEAATRLADAGADALGLSCAPGPRLLPPLLEPLLASGLPVSVMVGLHAPGHPPPYPGAPDWSPREFAAGLAPLAGVGVGILGGCCGVTPAHIAALAQALAARGNV